MAGENGVVLGDPRLNGVDNGRIWLPRSHSAGTSDVSALSGVVSGPEGWPRGPCESSVAIRRSFFTRSSVVPGDPISTVKGDGTRTRARFDSVTVLRMWTSVLSTTVERCASRARRQSPALLRASGQPEGEPATDGARRSRMAVGACGDRHGHAAACGRLGRRAYKRRNVTSRRKSRFRPREWCPAVGRAKSTASRSCAVGSIASSSVPLESHRWRTLRAFVSSPRLCCIKGRAGSSRPRVRSQVQPEGARAPTRVEDELQPLGR